VVNERIDQLEKDAAQTSAAGRLEFVHQTTEPISRLFLSLQHQIFTDIVLRQLQSLSS